MPSKCHPSLILLAHEDVFAGHLGRNKTHSKLASEVYWKNIFTYDSKHYMSYHVCQVVGKPNPLIPPYPLQKVPIVGEAFSKVFIYVVGPLPKRRSGNQFLLTIMFLTTQTPIPLRKVTAPVVVSVLLKYFK